MQSNPGHKLEGEESVLNLGPESSAVEAGDNNPYSPTSLFIEAPGPSDDVPSAPMLVLDGPPVSASEQAQRQRMNPFSTQLRSPSPKNIIDLEPKGPHSPGGTATSRLSRLGVRAIITAESDTDQPERAAAYPSASDSPRQQPHSPVAETVRAVRQGSFGTDSGDEEDGDHEKAGRPNGLDRAHDDEDDNAEEGKYGPRPRMEGRTRQFAVSMFEKEGATTHRSFVLNEAEPEEHRHKGYVWKWLGVLEVNPPDTDVIDDSIPKDGDVPSYPTSRSSAPGTIPGQGTNSDQLTPEEEARQAQYRAREELKRKYLEEEQKRKDEEMMERMAKRMGLAAPTRKAISRAETAMRTELDTGIVPVPGKEGEQEPDKLDDGTEKAAPPPEVEPEVDELEALPWRPETFRELFTNSYWKRTCSRIVANPNFEAIVLVLIVGNCMTLALYRPTESATSKWNNGLDTTDLFLNCAFSLELIIRFTAAESTRAYISSFWNIFDIIMVGFGWLVLIPQGGGSGGAVKALRALRALRPLRTITRVESLRAIVVCFLEAIPLLSSVLGLYFLLLVVFAIAALMLFQEAYRRRCYDPVARMFEPANNTPQGPDELGCGGHRKCPTGYQCIHYSRGRGDFVIGYDNLGAAVMMVFQMTTLSNWSFMMYRAVDYTGWYVAIYFVLVVLIGSYFMSNMILAVLKNKFGKAQTMFENYTGVTGLAKHKRRRNALIKMLANAKDNMATFVMRRREAGLAASIASSAKSGASELDPETQWFNLPLPPGSSAWAKFRYHTAKVVHHKWFDYFFMTLIFANTIALACQYYGMSQAMASNLHMINLVLTVLFAGEVAFKMLGMGFWEWVSEGWNWFDLIVTLISIVDVAASSSGRLAVLRAIRVLRLFRLFKMMRSLQRIGNVLMKAMGSFSSITSLILLFVFVFTVIGMHAFGDIYNGAPLDPNAQTWVNFDSFPTALQAVFQVITLEDWDVEMYTTADNTNPGAYAFFLIWAIIGKYILLTIFLAVTLEAFESKYDEEAIKDAIQVKNKLEKASKPRVPRLGFRFRKNKEEAEAGEAAGPRSSGGVGEGGSGDGKRLSGTPDISFANGTVGLKEDRHSGGVDTFNSIDSARGSNGSIVNALGGLRQPSAVKPKSRLSIETRAGAGPLSAAVGVPDKSGASLISALKGTVKANQVLPVDVRVTNGSGYASIKNLDSRRLLIEQTGVSASVVESSEGDLVSRENSKRMSRKRGVRFAEGPVDESATEGGEDMQGPFLGPAVPKYLVPPSVLSWGSRNLSKVHPFEDQPSVYSRDASPAAASTSKKDLRTGPGPVSEGLFSGLIRGRHELGSGSRAAKDKGREHGGGDDDDAASVMSGMSAASGASSGISGISGTTLSSGQYEAMKDAMEAKFLMDDTASNTSSSIGSTRRADAEIIMGLREEQGKLSRKAREKYQMKHRFNPNAPPPFTGVSCFCIKPSSTLRQFLYRIVTKRKFDYFMVVLIIYQCALMTLEKPTMDQQSTLYKLMKYSDYALFGAFTLEALAKIVAFNFYQYIKRTNNQIDFLIVLISGILILAESVAKQAQFLKGLRVLRAFKPLRILTRSAGMQLVMRSLILSVTSIGNVTVIMIMFFVIFSILGVQLFGGQFYSCNDLSVSDRKECTGTYIDPSTGAVSPRHWANAEFNFDNLGAALQSLFITLTLDSYVPIVYSSMSIRGIDKQPKYGAAKWNVLFFIAFTMLVSFCLLNLYVGVVFYQFSRIRLLSQTGSAFLTSDQQEWVEVIKIVSRMKPIEKAKGSDAKRNLKTYCIQIVDSRWFDRLMSTIVGVNILFMCLIWYNEPKAWTQGQSIAEYIFTGVFVVEAIIKNIAYGPRLYFKQPMNRLDFFIVIASVASLLVDVLASTGLGVLQKIAQLFRIMRLSRIIRLIYRFKGMATIVNCFIISLPALWNVGALLGLLFFIYAYMGVIFFGKVQHGTYLNQHANFEDFGMALATLFRVATNDAWPGIMVECATVKPKCATGHCGSYVAYPYFYSFVLLGSIIMLNLFTAVLIENYEKQQTREGWRLEVSHLEQFAELWSKYDDGTGTIPPLCFNDILQQLPPPLGLGKYATGKDVLTFVADLDIPLQMGRVPFHRALLEIVQRVSGAEIPEGMLKQQIDKLYAKMCGPKGADENEHMNFSAFVTVLRIQKKWRSLMTSRRIAHRMEVRTTHTATALAPIEEIRRKQAVIAVKLHEVFDAHRIAREILEEDKKKAERERSAVTKGHDVGSKASDAESSRDSVTGAQIAWWSPARWFGGKGSSSNSSSKRNSSTILSPEEAQKEDEKRRVNVRVTPVVKSGISWKLNYNLM